MFYIRLYKLANIYLPTFYNSTPTSINGNNYTEYYQKRFKITSCFLLQRFATHNTTYLSSTTTYIFSVCVSVKYYYVIYEMLRFSRFFFDLVTCQNITITLTTFYLGMLTFSINLTK